MNSDLYPDQWFQPQYASGSYSGYPEQDGGGFLSKLFSGSKKVVKKSGRRSFKKLAKKQTGKVKGYLKSPKFKDGIKRFGNQAQELAMELVPEVLVSQGASPEVAQMLTTGKLDSNYITQQATNIAQGAVTQFMPPQLRLPYQGMPQQNRYNFPQQFQQPYNNPLQYFIPQQNLFVQIIYKITKFSVEINNFFLPGNIIKSIKLSVN